MNEGRITFWHGANPVPPHPEDGAGVAVQWDHQWIMLRCEGWTSDPQSRQGMWHLAGWPQGGPWLAPLPIGRVVWAQWGTAEGGWRQQVAVQSLIGSQLSVRTVSAAKRRENRRRARIAVIWNFAYSLPGSEPTVTWAVDVSATGVRFLSDTPLVENTPVAGVFPDLQWLGQGSVRRCTPSASYPQYWDVGMAWQWSSGEHHAAWEAIIVAADPPNPEKISRRRTKS